MTPLATQDDVEARLGRSLTLAESSRLDGLLIDGSAAVRRYVPQDFTEATTTDRLRVRNGRVTLPQRPVTAVSAVNSITGDPVLYTWEGFDSIATSPNVPDTFAWVPWVNGIKAVDVTYTHGFNPIPDDIIGVVCSIVMRALGRDPIDAGLTSESIQGYSYSLGAAGAAGALGMLQAEKDILDAYKREGSSARMDAL